MTHASVPFGKEKILNLYSLESSCKAFEPLSREDTILWSRGVRPVTWRCSVDPYLRNAETREDPTLTSKEGGGTGWNKDFVGVSSSPKQLAQKAPFAKQMFVN